MKDKQNQKQTKKYQKYQSEEEEEEEDNNFSDNQDYDSNENSANMGSSPEKSDSDDYNSNQNKTSKKQSQNVNQQQQVKPMSQAQSKVSNQQGIAKDIQMTNVRTNPNQTRNIPNQAKKQNNGQDSSSDSEEDEIPSRMQKNAKTAQPNKTNKANQSNKSKGQVDYGEDNKYKQQKNKRNNGFDRDNQNQQEEEDDDDNEDEYIHDKNDIEDQNWKKKLNPEKKQLQKETFGGKSALKQTAQAGNVKKGQKHVRMQENEEEDSDQDGEEVQQQDDEDDDNEEEEVYKQKTNKLREEKEIRQRIQEEKSKDKKQKMKKKTTKFDEDEEQEDDDDDDEDDDDEDFDYDDYDDYDSENVKKREEYDIRNTCQKWVGFLIILGFMSILYFVMISRGFASTLQRDNNKNKQKKEIPLFPKNNFPLDIQFMNEEYSKMQGLQERRISQLCKDDGESIYDFTLGVSSEQIRKFESYLDFKCKDECQTNECKSGCETMITYEITQDRGEQNEDKRGEVKKTQIQYGEMMRPYACANQDEVYFNNACQKCQDDCFSCSQFTHHCYNCYIETILRDKQCTQCQDIDTALQHFCIPKRDLINLSTISSGADRNLFILHTPPTVYIEENINQLTYSNNNNNNNNNDNNKGEDQPKKDQLDKEEEEQRKLNEQQNKENEKGDKIPNNGDQQPKKEKKLKKYPFVIILNDYRFTQDEVFFSKFVENYFEKAFILSIPYFKEMLNSTQIHSILVDKISPFVQKNYIHQVDFYAIVGMGLTGQLVNQIMLNQDQHYWQMKLGISTSISENSFVTIIHQDQSSFDLSISQDDKYFQIGTPQQADQQYYSRIHIRRQSEQILREIFC